MKLRALLGLFAVTLLAMAIAMPTNADTSEEAPTTKVAICHFSGHTADAPQPTTCCGDLQSDFVINYNNGDPNPTFCEDTMGGTMIWVSEKGAVNGHKVHPGTIDRIEDYR